MREQIDALMREYQGEVPGASVLVLREGQVVARCAYGLADLENHTPATPATNYRLGSVTKQFTAAAILLLRQDSRLALEDPIRKWLPTLPRSAADIRIRHLVTHTSGLVDYEELIAPEAQRPLRDRDVLGLLEGQRRTYFVPGTNYRYSNGGYALLALIVAQASGTDFASFLRQRIFLPLGMSHTLAYEEGVSSIPHRAFGYSRAGPAWRRSDQSLTSAVLGDGGIYSSIDDLARWDAALSGAGLLQADALRLAFTPATATDDPNVQYAYGWRISGATVWHSGETLGFRTVIVRWPQKRCSVVVLANRSECEPYGVALAVANLFLPNAAAGRSARVAEGVDPAARPLPERPADTEPS